MGFATPAAASCVRKIVLRKAIAHILGASVDFALSVCMFNALVKRTRTLFFHYRKNEFLVAFFSLVATETAIVNPNLRVSPQASYCA